MDLPAHYSQDLLFFFDGKDRELSLYETLFDRLEAALPLASVKVQKSQISFYGRHLFAAVSLPGRRKKDWPEQFLLVTFGLARKLDSPRIAVAVEPYPNRWTHHVIVERAEQIDQQLLDWIMEAYDFSQSKR